MRGLAPPRRRECATATNGPVAGAKRGLDARLRLGASALVAVVLSAACRPDPSGEFATATTLPTGPRRVAGVTLEPESRPPRPRRDAASAAGVVTLRTPLGADAALATLRAFFRAVVTEDAAALAELALPAATLVNHAGGQTATAHNFVLAWRQRFARHEYASLRPESLFRADEVAVVDVRQVDEVPAELSPSDGEVLDSPGGEDVLVQVRIADRAAVTERLFGDHIALWLRRQGERYLILRVAEDVQL